MCVTQLTSLIHSCRVGKAIGGCNTTSNIAAMTEEFNVKSVKNTRQQVKVKENPTVRDVFQSQ